MPLNRVDQMVLKFRDVLRETERFGATDLRAYQHKLLDPLLRHARAHVPFYRDRLAPLFDGETIDYARWKHLPLLTRAEAQRQEKALRAPVVPPHLGAVSAGETSGSTGRPLRYLKNELMDVSALAMTDRLYRWWKLDGAKPMATFVAPFRRAADPEGSETFGWRSGFLEGRNYLLDTSGDTDRHLNWLVRVGARYLAVYAAMVPPLAEQSLRRNLKLQFEAVVTRGGVVTPEMRTLCEEAFGGPVIDQYGADEIGQIACQCPRCGKYHVSSEAVLLEVLDEEGNPVGPGETGRVVLTNLYNYAMPLIRYEIGDYATRAARSHRCRVRLPALSSIIGRYRNTFRLADGRVLFPNMAMGGFRPYLGFSQLQVVQTAFDAIEVRYVSDGSGRQPDRASLEAWVRESLDPCFTVRAIEVDAIAPASDGKYEDFLSLLDQPAKA